MEGKPLDIDGKEFRVRTPFTSYGFSAHAGKADLHKFIRESGPETVICVHGSEESSTSLAEDLKMEGFDAIAPKVGDVATIEF